MKQTILIFIRNINLLFLLLIFIGLFLVEKSYCFYNVLEIMLGIDLSIQGTSVIWCPDLFISLLTIGNLETRELPMWNGMKSTEKAGLIIVSLFVLFLGYVSINSGLEKLNTLSCFQSF